MHYLKYLFFCFFIFYIFSCGNKTESENKKTGENTKKDSSTSLTEISLTDKQFNNIGIELGGLEEKNINDEIKCNGIIDVSPQNMVSVSAPMGGFVKYVNLLIGDHVVRGQVLVILEHPDYIQLQEDYLKAVSQEKFLNLEFARQQELNKENVGAKRNLQQSESQEQNAKATLLALEAKLSMIGLPVHQIKQGKIFKQIPLVSPINGYVRAVNVNLGKFVSPTDIVIELINNDVLHTELQVFEKDIFKIHTGQKVIFKVNTHPNREMNAEVHLTGKTFDENTKTVNIHCDVIGKYNDILPGMYVNARIFTGDVLTKTLPSEAILTEGEMKYIFIEMNHAKEKHNFKKIAVKTGIEEEGFTEVTMLETLKNPNLIVKKGTYFINAAMKNTGEE